MTETDLDRTLTRWLAAGGERAPRADIDAALATVAVTAQRRRRPHLGATLRLHRMSPVALVVLITVVALVAAGIGTILTNRTTPAPTTLPSPSLPAATSGIPSEPGLRLAPEFRPWAMEISVPEAWETIQAACCHLIRIGGSNPEGLLAISHGTPTFADICTPLCQGADLPVSIPNDSAGNLAKLRTAVTRAAGSEAWTSLAPGVVAGLVNGQRLDSVTTDPDGRRWHRTYVIGLEGANLVAVSWHQPESAYEPALFDAVLEGLEVTAGLQPSLGELIETDGAGAGFTMLVPDLWAAADQPEYEIGDPAIGVRRYGGGRLVVQIGGWNGSMWLCDPTCRSLRDIRTLADLLAALQAGAADKATNVGVLDGAFALSLDHRTVGPGSRSEVVSRYIFAMVDGRPVVLTFDLTGIDVSEQAISSMRESFRLGVHALSPPTQTFEWGEGHVQLALPDGWELRPRLEGEFRLENDGQRLSVHRGTDDGLIWPCGESAAPWDVCDVTHPATLQALADFVMPDPIADHGVSAPRGVQESGTLDGEPSIVVRIHGYEYPARGGQTLTYVVAFHRGQAYAIRMWSPRDAIAGEAEVIAGFRFTE